MTNQTAISDDSGGVTSHATVNVVLANAIFVLHLVLVAFVLLGPWVRDKLVLLLYMMTIPFLQLHWISNNDTCALTVAECKLRGVEPGRSFFHRLVSPVYNLHQKYEDIFLWALTYVLWMVAVHRYFTIYSKW
jgi:hypothetical protein